MLFRLPPEVLVLLIPVLLFALVFHEFSHAWIANKLGDPTARYAGRLTLNPIAHLDPMGGLMILFVGFGWAKPVPVDPRYLKNPREDMMKIAFAGPASNLLLAFKKLFSTRFLNSSYVVWANVDCSPIFLVFLPILLAGYPSAASLTFAA